MQQAVFQIRSRFNAGETQRPRGDRQLSVMSSEQKFNSATFSSGDDTDEMAE